MALLRLAALSWPYSLGHLANNVFTHLVSRQPLAVKQDKNILSEFRFSADCQFNVGLHLIHVIATHETITGDVPEVQPRKFWPVLNGTALNANMEVVFHAGDRLRHATVKLLAFQLLQ